jgi:hypothetical protein
VVVCICRKELQAVFQALITLDKRRRSRGLRQCCMV